MNTNIRQWLIKMGYDKNMPFSMTIENLEHTIESYVTQHSANTLVSGNEANPSENKKAGEVAVCRCLQPIKLIDANDELRCGWCNKKIIEAN